MISVIIHSLNDDILAVDLNALRIGDDREIEVLGDLRTDLRGITVDGLTAGDDQIVVQIPDRARDRGGRRPGVGAAEHSVGDQDGMVSAHGQSLAKDVIRLRQTHGQNGDFRAVLILQLQGSLQTGLIIRVHDGEHRASVQGAVLVKSHAALGVRYLLNANDNLHGWILLTLTDWQR